VDILGVAELTTDLATELDELTILGADTAGTFTLDIDRPAAVSRSESAD